MKAKNKLQNQKANGKMHYTYNTGISVQTLFKTCSTGKVRLSQIHEKKHALYIQHRYVCTNIIQKWIVCHSEKVSYHVPIHCNLRKSHVYIWMWRTYIYKRIEKRTRRHKRKIPRKVFGSFSYVLFSKIVSYPLYPCTEIWPIHVDQDAYVTLLHVYTCVFDW